MSDPWLHRFKTKIIIGLVVMLALFMALTMVGIMKITRNALLADSAESTGQLGKAISSGLRCSMLNRSPERIQETLDNIGQSGQVAKIFILNRQGRVGFSSDRNEIGKKYERTADVSCRVCHLTADTVPERHTILVHGAGGDVYRNVSVIYNEQPCFGCHPREEKINGKLIIDHPLTGTYGLIQKIGISMAAGGIACLLLLIPFMSRMINRYIDQIILKNTEINLVYSIMDSISKTIDMEELKNIVLDIVCDALMAEEVDLVLPKGQNGYRVVTRSATGEKYQRKKLTDNDPLGPVVERWCAGEVTLYEYSPDRTEVYLPIRKGDSRLALIAVRCKSHPLPESKLQLIEAICNHIAIAFENARLYSIAITDELTSLYTVRHFRISIDKQMMMFDTYGEKFALLMIDIDNFKKVNDTYGHPTGDAVLKKVAHCIAESVRVDDLAFRYGGEEFAVILPATALPGGLSVAERIRAQIEVAEIMDNGQRIAATVSVGLAVCPDNATTVKEIIVQADKSLYAAKHGGKNCVKASQTVARE